MKLALVVPLLLVIAESTASADPDPWFGHDKVLHFGVSGVIADVSYAASTQVFDARGCALLAAAGLTLAVGAGKETLDLAGAGDPSWRDFTWDVIGTAVGLAVAWSMDLFVRGPAVPLFSAPTAAHQQSFVVRF